MKTQPTPSPLRTFWSKLDATQRAALAAACDTSTGYIVHVINGRPCSPVLARHLQRETGGAVQPWHCRPNDWSILWPDLIGTPGAPRAKKLKAMAKLDKLALA